MNYLNAFSLQELSHRHKVAICRNKQSNIISAFPSKAYHVLYNICIYALFFCSPHIVTA